MGRAARQDKGHVGGHDTEMREVFQRSKGAKRRINDIDDEIFLEPTPPKRMSPFLNTPKERKEERRKVLRISIQKFRQMEDPEHFLRRSVLINNTLKKVQKEIRDEKQKSFQGYKSCVYRLRPTYDYDITNNCYLQSNEYISMFEDQIPSIDLSEKLVDDDNLLYTGDQISTPLTCNNQLASQCPSKSQQTLVGNSCDRSEVEAKDTLCSSLSDTFNQAGVGKACTDLEDVVFNNLIRALGET